MKIQSFEEFDIWNKAVELASIVYNITNKDKFEKDWWLRDQIRRSIVSVSSNIAEWFERNNNVEFIRFLKIAKWSCWEARTQLIIAKKVWYLVDEDFDSLKGEFIDLSNKIGWFIQYLSKHKEQWSFAKK